MSSEPDDAAELAVILDRHLSPDLQRARGPRSLERIRAVLTSLPVQSESTGAIDPDVAALLRLVGLEPEDPAQLAAEVATAIDAGAAAGIAHDAVPAVLQAYARGVGRIVAAEASVLGGVLRSAAKQDRADVLDRALGALMPVGLRGFELMRGAFLREALLGELAVERTASDQPELLTVAMVDLVASTKYLQASGGAELEQLVDVLFEAAQSATAGTGASVVKYIGDGVLLAGRQSAELAEVALKVVTLLEAGLPLSARGGLTHGPVLHRAGDVFGLPVNTAMILSKAARPHAVVADEPTAARLPAAMRGLRRTVTLSHSAFRTARVFDLQRGDPARSPGHAA